MPSLPSGVAEALREANAETYTTPQGETWRCIRYPGFRRSLRGKAWAYASDWGRLLSVDEQRVLRAPPNKGYCHTTVPVQVPGAYGGQAKTTVHQVVAYTFLGDPPSHDYTVDHINRVREDNCACNLRWASPTEQLSNREYVSHTLTVVDEGRAYASITEASRALGISRERLSAGLRRAAAGSCVTVAGTVVRVEAVRRTVARTPSRVRPGYAAGGLKRSSRKEAAFLAFLEGASVAAVAARLGLARSTVLGYIGSCARSRSADVLGRLAERVGLVSREAREAVRQAVDALGQECPEADYDKGYQAIARTLAPGLADEDWDVLRHVLRALEGVLDKQKNGD